MSEVIFICGANGVGKSSVIPHLRSMLSATSYEIHDFDERGVPEKAGTEWRVSETAYWLDRAEQTAEKGVTTVVCGFVKPDDFGEAVKSIGTEIFCIFLDARPKVLRERLTQRYTKDGKFDPGQMVIGKTVQEFIEGNVFIREQLRNHFMDYNCPVIDTSQLEPAEVAQRIVQVIRYRHLSWADFPPRAYDQISMVDFFRFFTLHDSGLGRAVFPTEMKDTLILEVYWDPVHLPDEFIPYLKMDSIFSYASYPSVTLMMKFEGVRNREFLEKYFSEYVLGDRVDAQKTLIRGENKVLLLDVDHHDAWSLQIEYTGDTFVAAQTETGTYLPLRLPLDRI